MPLQLLYINSSVVLIRHLIKDHKTCDADLTNRSIKLLGSVWTSNKMTRCLHISGSVIKNMNN